MEKPTLGEIEEILRAVSDDGLNENSKKIKLIDFARMENFL